MLEIYNEVITDLLNPTATNLQIREDIKRGCYVEGLSEQLIQNGVLCVLCLWRGFANNACGCVTVQS
jgi:kinesin family member 15